MRTRQKKQRLVPKRQWRMNPLLRLLLVCVLSLSMVQNAIADITNSAVATGEYESVSYPSNASIVNIPVSRTPRIELFKSSAFNDTNSDGFAQAGEKITYTFTVKNSGNEILNNIVITDTPLGITLAPIASLAIGTTSAPVTALYTITQADVNAGGVNNTASVTAATASGGTVSDLASDSVNPPDVTPADNDVTVTPLPKQILAVDDTVNNVNGVLGNSSVINIFTNDTLGGITFAPSLVNLTLSATNPVPGELTFNSSTGLVSVAPNTAPGVYDFGYTICEKANPTNCDPAIVTITVIAPTIIADDDDFSSTPISSASGGQTTTLYVNDKLNGLGFAPNAVVPSIVNGAGITGLSFDTATGNLIVPAGTPPGTYAPTYQICEFGNAANCDTAIATIIVSPSIDAINDDFSSTPLNSTLLTTPSVLPNDKLNGVSFPNGAVVVSLAADGGITGLVIDATTGILTIPATTPNGTYTPTYKICQTTLPTNCDQATAKIVVNNNATVTGTVFFDKNGNTLYDGGDVPSGANYIVELRDGSNALLGMTTTDSAGAYSITAAPGSGYTLVFKTPAGIKLGTLTGLVLPPGNTVANQNQPIDPSGIVYNSVTRLPVAGVKVAINDSSGTPLPPACLIDPAQQNQTTGADGAYRFDLVPGGAAACPLTETQYGLTLTNPPGYVANPPTGASTVLPPQAGPLQATGCPVDAVPPGGACQISASANPPAAPGAATYYMTFLLENNDPHVVNNHIPIDPIISSTSGFSKKALVAEARRGERVPYVIEANAVSFNPARIVDVMPAGFDFAAGSATANGVAIVPVIAGRTLTFNGLVPDGTNKIKLELVLIATVAVTTGPQVNNATLINPITGEIVGRAKATVTIVAEHVFDCGDIIGRVFDDKNRNGYPDKGEPGLSGVRIVTVKGVQITTDKNGLFHVACADIPDGDIGSNFILKLDTRTLPTGYRVTTENPAIVRLTRGKVVKMNFGASITRLVKFDMTNDAFVANSTELKPQWAASLDELIAVLAKDKSTLRLTYFAKTKGSQLATDRAAAVEKLITEKWSNQGSPYQLPIETRVIGSK